MRNDVVDSLIVGGSIAFVVLAIHVLTDGTSGYEQGRALLLAGTALAILQLMLTLRRTRRNGTAPDQPTEATRHRAGAHPARRNPFIRELNREWTGLDDHAIAPRALPAHGMDAGADEEPAGQPATNGQEPTSKPAVGPDEAAERSASG